jgi:hypothetical protein
MTSRMKSVQRQRLWVHLSVKCCTSILCVTIRCFESIEGEQVTCVSSNFVWQNSWPLITCVCWESTRVGVIYSYWFLEIWFNLPFQSSPFNLPPTPSVVWHTVNRLPEVNCEQALMLLADWGCSHFRATAKIDCVIPRSPNPTHSQLSFRRPRPLLTVCVSWRALF